MSIENISTACMEHPIASNDLPTQFNEQGELCGRRFFDIQSNQADNPNVIIVKESAEKTSSLVGSIFKTFGVITLTGGILGCFSLNPIGGLLLGAVASVALSPIVIALHIANRVVN